MPGILHAQQAPVISNITLNPSSPLHGQSVTVSALVMADTTLNSVTIVDLNIGNNISMTLAGGSTYQGTIPAQEAGATVTFRVRAIDNANRVNTSDLKSYTVGLNAPTNLNASFIQPEELEVELNWPPVQGATSYEIYRSLVPNADLFFASSTTNNFIDSQIDGNAIKLFYRVKAVKGNTKSNFSPEAVAQISTNTPPYYLASDDIGGELYNDLIIVSRDSILAPVEFTLDLKTIFRDRENDDLSFNILQPPDNLFARAEVLSEDILRVLFTGKLGPVWFTVTANDGESSSEPFPFVFNIDAPPVIGTPSTEEAIKDQSVKISVIVSDNNLDQVGIRFKRGGDVSFFGDQMVQTDSTTFEYTIPAFAVGDRGLEYSIFALDLRDLQATQPPSLADSTSDAVPFSLTVYLPGEGIRKETAQPTVSITPNAYRLISIPLVLEDASPAGVFGDDFGRYDNSEWRLFEPVHNTIPSALPEYPNIPPVEPGKAFWLVVREENNFVDSGAGRTVSTNRPYLIDLEPGWNYFGNPFAFPISLNQLRLTSNNSLDIRHFNGTGWVAQSDTSSLIPFEGYAISNNTTSTDELVVYPAPNLLAAANKTTRSVDVVTSSTEKLITITARAGRLQDTNHIILAESSRAGWDPRDLPDPPYIGDFVSVTFPHPDWQRPLKHYSTDARPVPAAGDRWPFEVASNVNAPVELTFAGLDDLPDHLQALLIDRQLGITQPLTENSRYIVSSTFHAPQQLELVIGTVDFVDGTTQQVETPVQDFRLTASYPNPFAQTTTIPFQLPEESPVTLQIYNILGERVATLLEGNALPAGRHHVVWDGTSDGGHAVANGMYILRFTAGSFTDSRKALLVR